MPTKTVVRTCKGEPTRDNLVSTQVTSSEIETEALEKRKKNATGPWPDRQRTTDSSTQSNRGLFFTQPNCPLVIDHSRLAWEMCSLTKPQGSTVCQVSPCSDGCSSIQPRNEGEVFEDERMRTARYPSVNNRSPHLQHGTLFPFSSNLAMNTMRIRSGTAQPAKLQPFKPCTACEDRDAEAEAIIHADTRPHPCMLCNTAS